MVGFYSGPPIDSAAQEAQGTSILPAPTGAGLGAAFSQGVQSMPTVRLFNDADSSDETPANRGRVPDIGPGSRGFGQPAPTPPSPMLDPADANKQFGLPGLSFSAPISQDAAQGLYDSHHAALVRQDIMNRTSGIAAGVGQTVAGFIPQIADPINLAASFIPVVGEARIGALLGSAADSFLTRGVTGAIAGATGQAALEPLNYIEDQQEHNDWTMGQALQDIAFGGLLGGGLHMAFGAAGDFLKARKAAAADSDRPTAALDVPPTAEQMTNPISARMEAAGPQARDLALRHAVSSILDDQPNNVSGLTDIVDGQKAQDELTAWTQQQQSISSEQDKLLGSAIDQESKTTDQQAALQPIQDRLQDLQTQHAQLGQEAQAARARAAGSVDDATVQRIAAIEQELSDPATTGARRDELTAERTMVTEGSATTPEADELSQARAMAEAQGLESQQARLAKEIAAKSRGLETRKANISTVDPTTDRSFRINQARLASKQEVTAAMTARSIRRYAGKIGVPLEDGAARAYARRILDDPKQIPQVVKEIAGWKQGLAKIDPDTLAGNVSSAADNLRTEQTGAAQDFTASMERKDTPEIIQARRANDATVQRAPAIAARDTDSQLAEATVAYDKAKQRIQASGDEGFTQALADHEESTKDDEGYAKALEAAGSCLASRVS